MKLSTLKRNLGMDLAICGICFLFICVNITPATMITTMDSMRISEGDIPTWTAGDSWTYTINPLSFSSPNGSFDGSIDNFKQTVAGKSDDTYTISISGDITGDVDVNGFQGELTGYSLGNPRCASEI